MRTNEEAVLQARITNAENAARVRLEALQAERDDLLVLAKGLRDQVADHAARLAAVETSAAALQANVATIEQTVSTITPVPISPEPSTPGQVT